MILIDKRVSKLRLRVFEPRCTSFFLITYNQCWPALPFIILFENRDGSTPKIGVHYFSSLHEPPMLEKN